MDYVLKKLNNYIDISEDSVERQTLLRERIEYMLYIVFGYLWSENKQCIEMERHIEIVKSMDRMSIGELVGAIRNLDSANKIIGKKQKSIIDKYPSLRNEKLGHGYTHEDSELKFEEELSEFYSALIEIGFFKNDYEIIIVNDNNGQKYKGIRMTIDGNPQRWECPIACIDADIFGGEVFLYDKIHYYKISPFITIENRGEDVFLFRSLEDRMSGKVKYNQIFKTGHVERYIRELKQLSYESKYRRIASNRVIMNFFEQNYSNYIPIGIEKDIKNFISYNQSNVQATVWGHGGIGKTACVQNICMQEFNSVSSEFSYIVFTSAKDRKYDYETGKIISIDNLRKYEDIINTIIEVISDDEVSVKGEAEKESVILSTTGKILLVIDDYETFTDDEKKKIQVFLSKVNIDNFKVIITTRNRRLSNGYEISIDEFGKDKSIEFLKEIIKTEYYDFYSKFIEDCKDGKFVDAIYNATSGRSVFLYQFANIYVQGGASEDLARQLKDSRNAQDFLYGRVFTYLSDMGKRVFKTISQITMWDEMVFKLGILYFVLDEYEVDEIDMAVKEIEDLKIIERYDEDSFRVYSKELMEMMSARFDDESKPIKDRISGRIREIGGINIPGTVDEALLDKANASRSRGNVKETVENYIRILNSKKCRLDIKKKALINLTSYYSTIMCDTERAVEVFEKYVDNGLFSSDPDVLKAYASALWSMNIPEKVKACDILERYFSQKNIKKTSLKNLELFAMTVNYCSQNAIENTPDKVKKSVENRILNDYCRVLWNYIQKHQLNEFKPAIKHNVSLALISTLKLSMDLSAKGYNKSEYVDSIIEYGMKNFNELFYGQIVKIKNSLNKSYYKVNEVVEATIIYVAVYGFLVKLRNGDRALIHNTWMYKETRFQYSIGDIVKAKVIGKNEKGYILSMKECDIVP